MDHITNTLQGELRHTLDRLRDLGGAIVFEDYPGALESGADGEVGGDSVNASEERELTFTVRGRLVERANRLADALDRLRSGEYGTCQACGSSIAAARLRAMPEVSTCVACQEAEEMGLARTSLAGRR
jgi:RNA polymerase-binding transcription factor DksA